MSNTPKTSADPTPTQSEKTIEIEGKHFTVSELESLIKDAKSFPSALLEISWCYDNGIDPSSILYEAAVKELDDHITDYITTPTHD